MPAHRTPGLDRRDFLRGATAVGLGMLPLATARAATPPGAEPGEEPRVRSYAPLGRTGLRISDISFGSSRLRGDDDLVRFALDRGINYFDTAEGYAGGRSEQTIGRALEGRRDEVVLASKVKCETTDTRDALMRALEGSLRRLRTDRIDVYFNHAVNDVARLRNDEWYEFAARAKAAGKIRFTGMSGHGGRLAGCLEHALDHDLVDVILVAYNFGQDPAFYESFLGRFDFIALQPELPELIARARAKGVGVIAMKTLMGAKLNDLRPYETGGATFAQAAFRWVLSNPEVDALIVSMTSRDKVSEFLGASGARQVTGGDLRLLRRYAHRNGGSQCRQGCDQCHGSCPAGVEISEVLRTRMYAVDYEDLELARADYAALGRGASPCVSCTSRACLGACPVGIEIPAATTATHRMLA